MDVCKIRNLYSRYKWVSLREYSQFLIWTDKNQWNYKRKISYFSSKGRNIGFYLDIRYSELTPFFLHPLLSPCSSLHPHYHPEFLTSYISFLILFHSYSLIACNLMYQKPNVISFDLTLVRLPNHTKFLGISEMLPQVFICKSICKEF